jgi:hypothetical protein
MDRLVIDDYYPKLPTNTTLKQRMVRQMLQVIEEQEFCYKRLGKPIQHNPAYDKLKVAVRKLTAMPRFK